MESKYNPGDILTVQVKVKEVIYTEEGIEYAVVDKKEGTFITLRIPESDVLNCIDL